MFGLQGQVGSAAESRSHATYAKEVIAYLPAAPGVASSPHVAAATSSKST
jgi:hypothetical protein